MTTVYLGLGSNIDPEINLRMAATELRERYDNVRFSKVYRSPPVGFEGPEFLNLVAELETDEAPEPLVDALEEIHAISGRERGSARFVSRPLDIDLLLYGDRVCDKLRVPRDDVLEYGFVLEPLAEIAPDVVHPVSGRTIASHLAEFDRSSHPLTPTDVIL